MINSNTRLPDTKSIKQKIVTLIIIVAAISSLVSLFFSIQNIQKELFKENKTKVSYATEIAYNIIKNYKHKADLGIMTKKEAQQAAIQEINAIKYNGSNYVWINDYNCKFLAHPKKQGQDGSTLSDKNGVKIIIEGNAIAKKQGEGFLEYQWVKPNENPEKTFTKISHIRNFPDWGWVIASGCYISDFGIVEISKQIFFNILISNIIAIGIIVLFIMFTTVKDIVNSMNIITVDLSSSSSQIAVASSQLETSSQRLAEASAEQASAIQETSATLEETSSMVKQNNQNTEQAAILAKQSKECAYNSNQDMQKMMDAMAEIKKSSNEISKIIKVIDDIAFQTNILALNAAVEAARAGDAGLGFAVVAEEVRNLAQRSTQAAKDTTQIIESNINVSDQGTNIAKTVYNSISEIDIQAKKVSELLDEIAAATNEQSQGIEQIHRAISQMESVLQSNVQIAEQSAGASQELFAQTLSMNGIVERLTKFVNGAQNHSLQKSLPYNKNNAQAQKIQF